MTEKMNQIAMHLGLTEEQREEFFALANELELEPVNDKGWEDIPDELSPATN